MVSRSIISAVIICQNKFADFAWMLQKKNRKKLLSRHQELLMSSLLIPWKSTQKVEVKKWRLKQNYRKWKSQNSKIIGTSYGTYGLSQVVTGCGIISTLEWAGAIVNNTRQFVIILYGRRICIINKIWIHNFNWYIYIWY